MEIKLRVVSQHLNRKKNVTRLTTPFVNLALNREYKLFNLQTRITIIKLVYTSEQTFKFSNSGFDLITYISAIKKKASGIYTIFSRMAHLKL